MFDAMMLKGRRGNARFEVLFCGKKVLPVTLDPALQTHLSTQKTCNCIRIFRNLAVQFEGRNLAI
jgi:hypothetical protein